MGNKNNNITLIIHIELKENELLDKYIQNPDYKQFIDFVYEYNEEIIQMNKKTDIINSKNKKISNDINGLLKEPSFKLQRNLMQKKVFKNNNINNSNILIKKQKSFSNQKHSYDDKFNNSNSKNNNNNNNNNKINSIKQLNITNKFNIITPFLYKSFNFITELNSTKNNNININNINNNINNNNQKKESKLISQNKTNSYTYRLKNSNIKPKLSFKINIINKNINKTKTKSNSNNTNTNNNSNEDSFILNKYSVKTHETKKSSDTIFMNIETILSKNTLHVKRILEKYFNIFELKKIIGHENVSPIMGKTILDAFGLINDKIILTKN